MWSPGPPVSLIDLLAFSSTHRVLGRKTPHEPDAPEDKPAPSICPAETGELERGIRNLVGEAMATSSFRDSINSLGWSRREADIPVNTSQQSGLLSSLKSLNPFGDRGYVQLPTTEGAGAPLPASNRRDEEEGWFACESTVFLLPRPSHISSFCFPSKDSSPPFPRFA